MTTATVGLELVQRWDGSLRRPCINLPIGWATRAGSLAEIARRVGVSEATVSRVLNEKPGVSESTRTAVHTAMDVLGYRRSTALVQERFRLVGVMVPELRNPVFPAFAENISAVLAQRNLASVVCVTGQGGIPETDYVEMLLERRVSGVVFVCTEHIGMSVNPTPYLCLMERGLPLVAVNGTPDVLRIPCISTDDAADLAVRHLADLGHERIGLVTGEDEHVPAARKIAAFHEHMRARFTLDDVRPLIERSMYTMEGGLAANVAAAQARGDRRHLRQRRDGGGSRPRRAPGGPEGARGCVSRRLRRLRVHAGDRPAPDHDSSAGR